MGDRRPIQLSYRGSVPARRYSAVFRVLGALFYFSIAIVGTLLALAISLALAASVIGTFHQGLVPEAVLTAVISLICFVVMFVIVTAIWMAGVRSILGRQQRTALIIHEHSPLTPLPARSPTIFQLPDRDRSPPHPH